MIIKNVPDLFHMHEKEAAHVFDKNGRFIFIYKRVIGDYPKFIVYDTKFNKHIVLSAGESIIKFNNSSYTLVIREIVSIHVVDLEHLLVASSDFFEKTVLLVLLSLDYQQRTFEVLDAKLFNHHYQPEILGYEKAFGLFCGKECKDGRKKPGESNDDLLVYVMHSFKLESDKIVVGSEKEFHYDCYEKSQPVYLHLHKEKVWFLKLKVPEQDEDQEKPSPSTMMRVVEQSYWYIAYFDLKERQPAETWVDYLRQEDDGLLNLQWTTDGLLTQVHTNEFRFLDLNSLQRTTLKSSVHFINTLLCGGDHHWISLSTIGEYHPRPHFSYFCDDNLVLTAVSCPDSLYQVPLRTLPNLMDMAWTGVLNNNHLDRVPEITLKYKPLF